MTASFPDPLALVGGGNMARALVAGLRARGWPASRLHVAEPVPALREALAADFGVDVSADNAEVVARAPTWVLAVKPQVLPQVCAPLADLAQATRPLVVSIAAGVSTRQLGRWLGAGVPIVRAMPNLPAMVGAGATALVANDHVTPALAQRAQVLLEAVGSVTWLDDEAHMDAVTGVSGTGPAYLFLLAEAMQAAAVAQGLDPESSRQLIRQTLLGAARLLADSDEPAAVLRERVTSPGGTTAAAMRVFEAQGFVPQVCAAIDAATRRAGELSAALETQGQPA
jgi:pyrroline-5-carboxylate reductase